eukprot:gene4594-6777_t
MSAARGAGLLARRLVRSPAQRMQLRGELDKLEPGQSLPFRNGPANKVRVFTYVFGFLTTGFAAPFL